MPPRAVRPPPPYDVPDDRHTRAHTPRPPQRRHRALLVLVLLAGLFGMHALAPGGGTGHAGHAMAAHHSVAVTAPDDRPDAAGHLWWSPAAPRRPQPRLGRAGQRPAAAACRAPTRWPSPRRPPARAPVRPRRRKRARAPPDLAEPNSCGSRGRRLAAHPARTQCAVRVAVVPTRARNPFRTAGVPPMTDRSPTSRSLAGRSPDPPSPRPACRPRRGRRDRRHVVPGRLRRR
ncbi:hypothetical protein LT493_32700 [Streptomyces tricolor]|nr:hypothetical protein [Streptomyces tricolor]